MGGRREPMWMGLEPGGGAEPSLRPRRASRCGAQALRVFHASCVFIAAALALLPGAHGARAQSEAQIAPAPPDADERLPLLNRLPEIGAEVDDPIASAKQEIENNCLRVEYPKDFVSWKDLNADGVDDAVISFNVVCDGYYGALCGAGSCPGRVFVSDEEGVFHRTSLPTDAQPAKPYEGRPAVTVTVKGAACGLGVPQCRRVRVWNGSDFVPPELLTAEGRAKAAEREARRAALREAQAQRATEDDYQAAAALFDPSGGVEDATAQILIDAADEEGKLYVAEGWRGFDGGVWSYDPVARGRALAWIESDFGPGELKIACRAGDQTAALGFRSSQPIGAAAQEGDTLLADVVIAGRARASLTLRYSSLWDLWVTRIEHEGAVSEWLRRGSRAAFWEAGAAPGFGGPLGTFVLNGSRRAIEAAYRACGFMPPPPEPVAAPRSEPAPAQRQRRITPRRPEQSFDTDPNSEPRRSVRSLGPRRRF